MRIGALRTLLASTGALLVLFVLPCALAGATSIISPLPASDYTVRHVCATPAPGHAGCMALKLVPATAAARDYTHPLVITRSRPIEAANPTEGAFGLRPQDLHSVYQLPNVAPSSQTIAIVDAYNDLSAEADLGVYDQTFGLPVCTVANGCFRKINQQGEPANPPFPDSQTAMKEEEAICTTEAGSREKPACEEVEEADGWSEEISLDIEVSHAVCQTNCHIVLVEAASSNSSDLETAEEAAAGLGATEISNSWGGPELPGPPATDTGTAFDRPGIAITASSGDDGYLNWDAPAPGPETAFADYPASSPHVVAVGGTRLSLNRSDEWAGETVWNGNGADGGGCSVRFTAQPWQQNAADWPSVGCGKKRAVADVSADADPYTGVAVYDSAFECEYEENHVAHTGHWCTIGGTSLASPLIAATFALAGGANGVTYPARTLFENESKNPARLHDILSGSNGECSNPFDLEDGPLLGTSGCTSAEEAAQCSEKVICLAGPAYDGPTGVGTPDGIAAFQLPGEGSEKEKLAESSAKGSGEEGSPAAGKEVSGGAGSGGEAREGFAGLSLPPGAHPSGPSLSIPGSSSVLPILTAASLTHRASTALRRGPARIATIAFAFTLNMPARVQVVLAQQVLVHGHRRWRSLPDSLTIIAAKGRDGAHLRGRRTLSPGRYRLTLTPLHGRARTLTFQIG
jgi:hypothetical protein